MPARNLELKVECGPDALTDIRARLATADSSLFAGSLISGPERLRQVDTYYQVARGRLKLRQIDRLGADVAIEPLGRSAELIGYERPEEAGSRWSTYRVAAIDPEAAGDLHEALSLTHEVLIRVAKRRDVVRLGATRFHLDEVDDLGAFVELETVIGEQDDSEATREHESVISMLELDRFTPIAGSYSDLLLRRSSRG